MSKKLFTSRDKQSAFVLPTVLVLSVVLLTLGLSVFQLTSSIARSLTDQYWQRLARQATQAGVSYMSACVDQGLSSSTWPASITQDNSCLGASLGTQTTLYTSYTSGTDNASVPNPYKSRFTIYKPSTGSDGIPKARIVGAVDLQSSADGSGNRTTIKTYTYEITSLINGPTRSSSQLSSERKHTCGISDGQAYCWGTNAKDPYAFSDPSDNDIYGQLGRGSSFTGIISSTPDKVDTSGVLSGKTVTAIAAGYSHACAIASGKVYCWGDGTGGALGNSANTISTSPVAVTTEAGLLQGKVVTAIAAGWSDTCAIASGNVYCWGDNWAGQVGDNSTTQRNKPVLVNTGGSTVLNGKKATSLSMGYGHSCAIADGKPACWGYNADGELGDNTRTNRLRPVNVVTTGVLNGKYMTSISGGSQHTCAVASGAAYCWGTNGYYGILGNGSGSTDSIVPVAVSTAGALSGKTVTAISSNSYDHNCVIANSQAYCWGSNDYFPKLGNGTSTNSTTPTAVSTAGVLNGKALTGVSIGQHHSCVIGDGQIYCWGHGDQGQLGNAKDRGTQGGAYDPSLPVKSINTF